MRKMTDEEAAWLKQFNRECKGRFKKGDPSNLLTPDMQSEVFRERNYKWRDMLDWARREDRKCPYEFDNASKNIFLTPRYRYETT